MSDETIPETVEPTQKRSSKKQKEVAETIITISVVEEGIKEKKRSPEEISTIQNAIIGKISEIIVLAEKIGKKELVQAAKATLKTLD
jgi:hypothetical protein